ncbi:MAG TPA: twin-arginine translocase TatA/TatE family subunit [Bryobacteraceae bacterium]|nr:twin-arginine translocase TatA/TatE family subunit [Bryobacteraceae bacterium]
MGSLGTPEIAAIFLLSLLLFGPKELPKLGKTIGKAMAEFRKAQSELKTTFDREMKNLEQETGIKELVATNFQSNNYNYEPSSYDPDYYSGSYAGSYNSTETTTTAEGASATQGAGSTAPLQVEAAHGSIASGHLNDISHQGDAHTAASTHPEPAPANAGSAEHGHSAPAETAPHNG